MTDAPAQGPFHLTIEADVRVTDPARADEGRLAEVLTRLLQGHAWEAGLEVVGPHPLRVVVVRHEE